MWLRDQARGKGSSWGLRGWTGNRRRRHDGGRHVRGRKKVEIGLACWENCTSFLRLPESGAGAGRRGGQGPLRWSVDLIQ